MPCNDGGGPSYANDRDLNLVSAILCGVIRSLTHGAGGTPPADPLAWADAINWEEVGFTKQEALEWWSRHTEIDAKREEALKVCVWKRQSDTDLLIRKCSGKVKVMRGWHAGQGVCPYCQKQIVIEGAAR